MRRFQIIKGLLLASMFCVLAAAAGPPSHLPDNTVQGRVSKVLPSPGFWTGVIPSIQWFDLTVTESRVPTIKPEMVLHIGVPVLQGSALFEKQTPQFANDKVATGKLLDVKISAKCSKRQEAESYVVETKCIQVMK